MVRSRRFSRFAIASMLALSLSGVANAAEFSFTFEWGDIPLCNTGSPNRVSNPIFTLSGVPDGTKKIKFQLTDWDAPNYNHGGGTAAYSGQNVVQPGAFKYESPCPPGAVHTYEWTAYAKNADGKTIAKAKAKRQYPQ